MNENIVSLKSYKTLKEGRKLFQGYRTKLSNMEKQDLIIELERYRKEAINYPHHLLTLAKGEIIINATKGRSITEELRVFVQNEEQRLNMEVKRRLHEEWP